MITTKIIGVDELVQTLSNNGLEIASQDIDAIMTEAAKPIVSKIKSNYKQAKHIKTGALVDSISIFKGSKRSRVYDRYTYYIGPRYSTKNSLSAGGNAAHLLEWGTNARHKADIKKGGYAGKGTGRNRKQIYGAKIHLGGVKGSGVLRRSYDEIRGATESFLSINLTKLIINAAQQKGFKIK